MHCLSRGFVSLWLERAAGALGCAQRTMQLRPPASLGPRGSNHMPPLLPQPSTLQQHITAMLHTHTPSPTSLVACCVPLHLPDATHCASVPSSAPSFGGRGGGSGDGDGGDLETPMLAGGESYEFAAIANLDVFFGRVYRWVPAALQLWVTAGVCSGGGGGGGGTTPWAAPGKALLRRHGLGSFRRTTPGGRGGGRGGRCLQWFRPLQEGAGLSCRVGVAQGGS